MNVKRIVPKDDPVLLKSYADLLDIDHEIIEDECGVYRWRESGLACLLLRRIEGDMNGLWRDYREGRFTTEEFKRFYRDIGYSLCGYTDMWDEAEGR